MPSLLAALKKKYPGTLIKKKKSKKKDPNVGEKLIEYYKDNVFIVAISANQTDIISKNHLDQILNYFK
jgi:hypothetical protein